MELQVFLLQADNAVLELVGWGLGRGLLQHRLLLRALELRLEGPNVVEEDDGGGVGVQVFEYGFPAGQLVLHLEVRKVSGVLHVHRLLELADFGVRIVQGSVVGCDGLSARRELIPQDLDLKRSLERRPIIRLVGLAGGARRRGVRRCQHLAFEGGNLLPELVLFRSAILQFCSRSLQGCVEITILQLNGLLGGTGGGQSKLEPRDEPL
mmetsp:Transcript_4130/g.11854  ORF Transcript_4130/g.11854 Transcript_4130/m.11854 type:complete len:209 (+) Transcript_4130:850-1476(+)